MKTLLLAIPVIAAVAAAPYVVSKQAEQRFSADMTRQSEQLSGAGVPMRLELVEYVPGYLSSQSEVLIKVDEAAASDADLSGLCIAFVADIHHDFMTLLSGNLLKSVTRLKPLAEQPCYDETDPIKREQFLSYYNQQFGTEGPLLVVAEVGFSGTTSAQMETKPIQFESAEVSLDIQPMRMDMDLSADQQHVDWTADVQRIHFAVAEQDKPEQAMSMSLAGLRGNGSQQQHLNNLWLGDTNISYDSFDVAGVDKGEPIRVAVKSVQASTSNTVQDGYLTSQLTTTVDDISVLDQDLGDMQLDIGVSQLQAQTLDEFFGVYRELVKSAAQHNGAFDPQQQQRLSQLSLELAKTAEIKLKQFEYSLQGSRFTLASDLKLQGMDTNAADALMMNPAALLQYVVLHAESSLDEDLITAVATVGAYMGGQVRGASAEEVERVGQFQAMQMVSMLQQYVQAGLINYDAAAKRYSSKVVMGNGAMQVNGMPIPLFGAQP